MPDRFLPSDGPLELRLFTLMHLATWWGLRVETVRRWLRADRRAGIDVPIHWRWVEPHRRVMMIPGDAALALLKRHVLAERRKAARPPASAPQRPGGASSRPDPTPRPSPRTDELLEALHVAGRPDLAKIVAEDVTIREERDHSLRLAVRCQSESLTRALALNPERETLARIWGAPVYLEWP